MRRKSVTCPPRRQPQEDRIHHSEGGIFQSLNRYRSGSLKRLFLAVALSAIIAVSLTAFAEPIPAEGTVEVQPERWCNGCRGEGDRRCRQGDPGAGLQLHLSSHRQGTSTGLEARREGSDKGKKCERYSEAKFLADVGMPTYLDGGYPIAHNKIMLVNGDTIITGSFNFTRAAEERNAENLLVIKGNKGLIEQYLANYVAHRSHSVLYRRNF